MIKARLFITRGAFAPLNLHCLLRRWLQWARREFLQGKKAFGWVHEKIFRRDYLVLVCGLITQHYSFKIHLRKRGTFFLPESLAQTEVLVHVMSSQCRANHPHDFLQWQGMESRVWKRITKGMKLNSYFTLFIKMQFKLIKYLNVES